MRLNSACGLFAALLLAVILFGGCGGAKTNNIGADDGGEVFGSSSGGFGDDSGPMGATCNNGMGWACSVNMACGGSPTTSDAARSTTRRARTRSTTWSSSSRTMPTTLPAIKPGTNTCNTCDAPIGDYVVATTTDADGAFTLTGVPTGKAVPAGRADRQVAARGVPSDTADCTDDHGLAGASLRASRETRARGPAADGAAHRRSRQPRLLPEAHRHRRQASTRPSRRRAARHLPGPELARRRADWQRPGAVERHGGQLHERDLPAVGVASRASRTTTSSFWPARATRRPGRTGRRQRHDRRRSRRCTTGSTRAARSSRRTSTTPGSRTARRPTSRGSRPGSARRSGTGMGQFAIDTSFPKGQMFARLALGRSAP